MKGKILDLREIQVMKKQFFWKEYTAKEKTRDFHERCENI